ncbi:MAG: alpha/beta hydrolase [Acidimicrobiales bacterium]|nr:alpha/beta hydrolase [Acidimicrobiales bacterium]
MLTSYADGTIYGSASLEGKPKVLALHGWGRSYRDFGELCSIEKDVPILSIDLPGFGESPPPEKSGGSLWYAEMLKPIVDQLDSRPILVGHSFGGRVAIGLIEKFPDRFGGLILTGVPLIKTPGKVVKKPPAKLRLAKFANKYKLAPTSIVDKYRNAYGSPDYKRASGVMRQVLVTVLAETNSGLYVDWLMGAKLPVVLLWGEMDLEIPISVAQSVRESLGADRCELRAVKEGSHFLPTEHPFEIKTAIHDLLKVS